MAQLSIKLEITEPGKKPVTQEYNDLRELTALASKLLKAKTRGRIRIILNRKQRENLEALLDTLSTNTPSQAADWYFVHSLVHLGLWSSNTFKVTLATKIKIVNALWA